MQLMRSLLFVPGHKAEWIGKALASGADAIIIDLEDAVPGVAKQQARDNARAALASYQGPVQILVRVNALDTEYFGEDIAQVTHPNLAAFLLPKLFSRDCLLRFDGVITAAEHRQGLAPGTTEVMASFETAAAISNAAEIIRAPRVGGIMAAAARDSDISREVGYTWSAAGTETLYLRSRLIIEGRAAGLNTLVLGLWQDLGDLAGLAEFAAANAQLGYTGQVLIHPSHVPAVNAAYGLSAERLDYYRRLVAAFDEAQRAGNGAVTFEGDHIDLAHARNARELLARYSTS